MRTSLFALAVVTGLCVLAGSGSAILQGQGNEKGGDDYTGRAQKFTPRPGADPAKIFRQQRLMPKGTA
jgi:hypothetical protein